MTTTHTAHKVRDYKIPFSVLKGSFQKLLAHDFLVLVKILDGHVLEVFVIITDSIHVKGFDRMMETLGNIAEQARLQQRVAKVTPGGMLKNAAVVGQAQIDSAVVRRLKKGKVTFSAKRDRLGNGSSGRFTRSERRNPSRSRRSVAIWYPRVPEKGAATLMQVTGFGIPNSSGSPASPNEARVARAPPRLCPVTCTEYPSSCPRAS